MPITEVMSGTKGYRTVNIMLAMAQKIITRRTPSRSNIAPLWIENTVASADRAPAAIPIMVADMPRLSRHHRGTMSCIIGRMPMLIKEVE